MVCIPRRKPEYTDSAHQKNAPDCLSRYMGVGTLLAELSHVLSRNRLQRVGGAEEHPNCRLIPRSTNHRPRRIDRLRPGGAESR